MGKYKYKLIDDCTEYYFILTADPNDARYYTEPVMLNDKILAFKNLEVLNSYIKDCLPDNNNYAPTFMKFLLFNKKAYLCEFDDEQCSFKEVIESIIEDKIKKYRFENIEYKVKIETIYITHISIHRPTHSYYLEIVEDHVNFYIKDPFFSCYTKEMRFISELMLDIEKELKGDAWNGYL